MKRWMLILIVLLFPIVAMGQVDPNADDDAVTFWMLGDHNAFLSRSGYQNERIEVGAEVEWNYNIDEDNDPLRFGAYGIYHLPEALNVENLPVFSMLGESIQGVTYLGLHGGVETDWNGETDERYFVGPVAGAVINKFIFDSVADEISVITEVQYNRFLDDNALGNRDEFRVLLGIRIWIP